ncbi:hypothetical protein QBC36DRAFT_390143 [Triangularia setosa]|uniref:Uncharacterized protein n=1 Tax=Triangularia setosa TaxID=2587417 RepID=A0AAN7A3M0_9PEZI|nr:hypothetical protein QBC36DRAFT_390143 [Podospora setosa]
MASFRLAISCVKNIGIFVLTCSRDFKTRLLEIVAIVLHETTVILFTLDTTLFRHPCYVDYEQYPHDAADMVGGVVLFNRRSSNEIADTDGHAIYFHPNRGFVTYRICRPLEDQNHVLLKLSPGSRSRASRDFLNLPTRADQLVARKRLP